MYHPCERALYIILYFLIHPPVLGPRPGGAALGGRAGGGADDEQEAAAKRAWVAGRGGGVWDGPPGSALWIQAF